MTAKQRKQVIEKLVKALNHHRLNPPPLVDEAYCKRLAIQFGLNWKTIDRALSIGAQEGLL